MKKVTLYFPLLLLFVVGLMASCTSEEKKEEKEESPFMELNAKQLQTMNINLAPPEKKNLLPIILATGKVITKPNSSAIVSSNIEGKIEKIMVVQGQQVRKGQPLFAISSMPLIELQQTYLAARNEAAFLKIDFERQAELIRNNIGALSEYQLTQSRYKTARNLEESISEKLKLLGVDLDQLRNEENSNVVSQIYIKSPIDGSVFKIPVTLGQSIAGETELAEIINLSQLHADIDVYEKDIDQISINQEASIEFVNQSIPRVTGKVEQIVKSIDPDSRSIPVFISFDTPENSSVLPEMRVKVSITGKNNKEKTYVLPKSALLQEGELFYIYTATQKDSLYVFKKIKIGEGDSNNTETEIVFSEALPENVYIVQNNVYLIDTEARKRGY
jgi:cobalt-zinc-cadmium efflux system membrane fusion protein